MEFLELLETISRYGLWDILSIFLATSTIIFSVYVYFRDPLARWQFFGYRPTAVVFLFDPDERKVLMIKSNMKGGYWHFPQGAIYEGEVSTYVEQTIKRELGISNWYYDFTDVRVMGTIKRSNKRRLKNNSLGVLSLRSRLIGKGYVACFVQCDCHIVTKKIKRTYHSRDFQWFTYDECWKYFEGLDEEGRPKIKLYLDMFQQIAEDRGIYRYSRPFEDRG
jgi:hypothetical protein